MNRTNIINTLLKNNKGKKYLEIGVYNGDNLKNVNCEYKIGVDPDPSSKATVFVTSDEFFKYNKENFDVIFIDGLHHKDQVLKDINNSLSFLNNNGFIVCHDMNPEKEEHQVIPYTGGVWNGDCWKAFVQLRRIRPDLEMFVIDSDYGCGVIRKGKQEIVEIKEEITWQNFVKNKKNWLNLISVKEFMEKFFINSKEEGLLKLIYKYVEEPENPENNYALGLYYEKIGQTASALSYYLRTAERTKDDLLQYECLIRSSICFDKQGARNFTVKGLLQHALAMQPNRPEGYYLLSRFYEKENKDGSWQDCYTTASIGCKVSDKNPTPLRTSVDYPGYYALLFQKAMSAWWCGLCEESRDLFKKLYSDYDLDNNFKQSVINNLNFLKVKYE